MVVADQHPAKLSQRVEQLKQSLLETVPRLSCERIRCLLESYRETDGEPPVIRRARVLEKLLTEMTLFVDENPIVGTTTQYRCGMQPFPENACRWMVEEVEASTSLGTYAVSPEDRTWLEKAAAYWQDRCRAARTTVMFRRNHPDEVDYSDLEKALFINTVVGARGRINIDYGKVLKLGLNGVIKEARRHLESLPVTSIDAMTKRQFLEGVIISCNAVITFARRYAVLAEKMAAQETNPERRRELKRIQTTCLRVPAEPPRSFHEAIQCFWFVHLASEMEETGDGRSPGRFGQYMFPFYMRDREAGRLTEEDALELLELLFIKFTEITVFKQKMSFAAGMGNMFQNISIGGLTEEGDDATNDLEYLLIEAQQRVQLIQPTLSLLYHDRLSDDFLLKAAALVRTGIGMPAFFNNDGMMQGLMAHGMSVEDARDCCIVGCVERATSHRLCSFQAAGGLSMPKLLELALNDGVDPATGKQFGPSTGEATAFKSYEDVEAATRTQMEYFLKLKMEWELTGSAVGALEMPQPFTSALVDDCIKEGKDMLSGGARYEMDGCTPVGVVDLADSLAAIKKLVFEDKSINIRQLLDALKANFEGHTEIHRALIVAPKFGNDDNYVDQIAKRWFSLFEMEHGKYTNCLGNPMRPFSSSVTFHTYLGRSCGALPSGRQAGVAFADASVSAFPSMDRDGPTALIHSATKVLDTIKYASGQLNMKFHPSTLEGVAGLSKLIALVKTYVDLGGHHIQFNVVSTETLKDAQVHPENYRNLIVRVAGFSAYFIHLDPGVQDEIIRRTEVNL